MRKYTILVLEIPLFFYLKLGGLALNINSYGHIKIIITLDKNIKSANGHRQENLNI